MARRTTTPPPEDYEERMSHERPTAEEQARVVKAMRGGYASAFGENARCPTATSRNIRL